jgi:hypothetical protein
MPRRRAISRAPSRAAKCWRAQPARVARITTAIRRGELRDQSMGGG